MTVAVIKVSGSLFDWPDLRFRLAEWLSQRSEERLLLVPGGGPATDAIRAYDRCHDLGEEKSHWLALRALTLNAWFLADLLAAPVVDPMIGKWAGAALLDAFAFCQHDEIAPHLPATWETTSDSVAAVAAIALKARELVLLKSCDTDSTEPQEWQRLGLVDSQIATLLRSAPDLVVRFVNLRRDSAAGLRLQ